MLPKDIHLPAVTSASKPAQAHIQVSRSPASSIVSIICTIKAGLNVHIKGFCVLESWNLL
jgi:hypothetical protein